MTSDEQLRRWVAGESVHRGPKWHHRSECVPDFSCCKPELLQPVEVRQAFAAAGERERMKLLGAFLAAACALASKKTVYVTGHREPGDDA